MSTEEAKPVPGEAEPEEYELMPEEVMMLTLDEEGAALQKDGRYLEALEKMEHALILRHRLYGARSAEVLVASKAAGELCNLLAMTYLQREEYTIVSELLKKAELLTEYEPAGRAVTYNNFACFSRQHGRLHASLSYLLKALRIEEKLDRVDNPADTHLNLCAVLSQLSRHKEALEHCQAALALLQEELFGGSSLASSAQKPDRIAVLAICYHNIGVECEFLKHYQASLQAYTKGVEVATVYLGHDHGITQTLMRSQESARVSIARFPARRPAIAKPAATAPSAGTHAYASASVPRRAPRAGAGVDNDGIAPAGSSRRKPAPVSSPAVHTPASPLSASKTGTQSAAAEDNLASYKKYSESPLRAAALASLT